MNLRATQAGRTSDERIIALLLGESSAQTEALRRRAQTDPALAERIEEWRRVLDESRPEQARIRRMQARVQKQVLWRILSGAPAQVEPTPNRSPWWGWRTAGLAAAGLAVIVAASLMLPLRGGGPTEDPARVASASQREAASPPQVVVLADANQGEPTAFSSLSSGVGAAEKGATLRIRGGDVPEALRIDKPVRLVALDGPVRIGLGARRP